MSTIKTRFGSKYKKVSTYPSRHSPGRVHVLFWSRDRRYWFYLCARDKHEWEMHVGDDLEWNETEVTCSKCAKFPIAQSKRRSAV